MSVCSDCMKGSDGLAKSLTQMERMHLLSSAVAMARSISTGRNDPQDTIVSRSVVTKLLLSFPSEARDTLVEHLKRASGIQITLGSCPHSRLGVV